MLTYRLQRVMRVNRHDGGIDTHLNDRLNGTPEWFSIRTERNISNYNYNISNYNYPYTSNKYTDDVVPIIRVDVYSMFSMIKIDYAFNFQYELPC